MNRFVFGEDNVKPIALSKDVTIEMATHIIQSAQGFDKLKDYWEKGINFIKNNNISISFLFDYS